MLCIQSPVCRIVAKTCRIRDEAVGLYPVAVKEPLPAVPRMKEVPNLITPDNHKVVFAHC